MSSVRLEPTLEEKVRRVARLTGVAVSDVHRRALAAYCDQVLSRQSKSRYSDVIGAGTGEGPSDLSRRTREAFGEMLEAEQERQVEAQRPGSPDAE